MALVTLPGDIVVWIGTELDRTPDRKLDWGLYDDAYREGPPGVVLDWSDLNLPANETEAIDVFMQAFARARQGQDILIRCREGTGRTGTVLACLAILAGVPAACVVRLLRNRLGRDAVQTQAQVDWVVDCLSERTPVRRLAERNRLRLINTRKDTIKDAMRQALRHPQSAPVLGWAVPDVLAVTQRPLRAHPEFGGSRLDYPAEARPAIEDWISRLLNAGVRTVVVLTSNKELAHYHAPIPEHGGLLALYKSRGLRVVHFPADDPAHDVTAEDAFAEAVDSIAHNVSESLHEVPLSAAMHCSAAMDRSPPVAARVAFLAEVGDISYPSPVESPS